MSNDYLIRQIETMTRAIALFIFSKKDYGEYEVVDEDGGFSRENFLRYALTKLVHERKLNDAENLLFQTLDEDPDPIYLPTALDFYEMVADLPDATLATCNFSRAELRDGLAEVMRRFDVTIPG